MKTATVKSRVLVGLEPRDVTVTTHPCAADRKHSGLSIVGLASDAATREAKVRVASALANMGVLLPEYPETVLVTIDPPAPGPAPQLDLPIAVAVLAALGKCEVLERVKLVAELALDGRLRPVRGVLPIADGGALLVAPENAKEAALSECAVRSAASLSDVLKWLERPNTAAPRHDPTVIRTISPHDAWSDLRTTPKIRRALEVAAAGSHSVLLVGPPGAGKTLIARALWSILPPMTRDETIEVTKIHSVAGLVDSDIGYVPTRPLRAPHHSVSEAGLCGGGTTPRPGEVSLAHRGVLFLDELKEFRLDALDTLCRVLQEGHVSLGNKVRATFPARPQLVASMSPCPCGYRGHPSRTCKCTPKRIAASWKRMKPFLNKFFDIRINVPALTAEELTAPVGEVEDPRERIAEARSGQQGPPRSAPKEWHDARAAHGAPAAWARVAATIFVLSGAESMTAEHVREAKELAP